MDIPAQPDIILLGLRIQEPITTLSDLLIATVCFFAFYKMAKNPAKTKSLLYFRVYFLLMGISTFWGGLFGHAFEYIVGFNGRLPGWYLSMIAIMFLERSSIEHAGKYMSDKVRRFLLWVNLFELAILVILVSVTFNFKFVEFHSAYGVLFVSFSLHAYAYYRSRNKGSKWMMLGVLIVTIAAIVFNAPLVVSKWFNHLDLAHVLMAITSVIFYKASTVFEEEDALETGLDLALK